MPLAGSKISRIELHRTGIKLADLVLLLDLYNVADVHREGGIGGAICRRLARDGFAVACFDLRAEDAAGLASGRVPGVHITAAARSSPGRRSPPPGGPPASWQAQRPPSCPHGSRSRRCSRGDMATGWPWCRRCCAPRRGGRSGQSCWPGRADAAAGARPTARRCPWPRESPASRVVAAAGSKYAAVIDHHGPGYAGDVEQQIKTLIRALLRRGIDDGTFRGDLSADELVFLLGSLLLAAARMAAERQAGVEKAAALVTSVFLHGTENRKNAAVDATRS